MIVTNLKKEMLAEVTALYMSVFSQEPWNDEFESVAQVETFMNNFLSSDAYVNFVAIEKSEIIGLCLGLKKPWINGVEYYIDEFCIKTELQGTDLGSVFLQKIESEVTKLGLNGIMLNTEKGFDSEAFYLKNGFHQISNLIVLGK